MRYRAIQLPAYRSYLQSDFDASQHVEITSNEVWDHSNWLTGGLTVKSGYDLTVKCTLHIAEDARIIVEPNAKLIIDGGVLTKNGDSRWDGIYVLGDNTKSQTVHPTYFGTVILKNGAVVEHAKEALNNFGLTSGGGIDWGTRGGVIQATETTFRNNRRSAQFLAYTNTTSQGNPINDKGFSTAAPSRWMTT